MRRIRTLLLLETVAALAGCGNDIALPQRPPAPEPGQVPLTARAFLTQANAQVQQSAPGARFYLLTGRDIDAQGVPDAASQGYWVASYALTGTAEGGVPTPTLGAPSLGMAAYSVEIIAVKGFADGTISTSTRQQSALPEGYALHPLFVPDVDSPQLMGQVGGSPTMVRLYGPLEPPYWSHEIYYVGDPTTGASITMVDALSGQQLSSTPNGL